MTNFEQILESMGVVEYATMKSDANKCPSNRTLEQCAYYKQNHLKSTACFFCWISWLEEEYTE